MTDISLAIVLGGAFGVGVCLLLTLAPRWGAPSLSRRIAPYLRDVADVDAMRGSEAGTLDIAGLLRGAQARLGALLGGAEGVERRLRQSGWPMDAAAFRARQLVWAVVGVAVGGVLVIVLVLSGRASGGLALLPPLCAVAGAVVCDARLTQAARARLARIEEELPTVLEFLALCLSAGEGILDSLRRVGEVGSGELTAELRGVVLAVGTGSPLGDSLALLARRLDVPALTRSIDQLVAAIERGAPLAQVLHAQALDAREDAKRGLIERAGRKEIAMLLPLVFLILPLSVLFAVFPGVFMLRLGIG
ncbi:type II secretion system F family protein [Microbacterium ulmi]|uniref:type II secretion system F family protein n=1 Tax=Microbacterium ulmi TaxID=179095 RepID=UPI0031333909|nr:tight adherence protein C [Microbacterium ulmi]